MPKAKKVGFSLEQRKKMIRKTFKKFPF